MTATVLFSILLASCSGETNFFDMKVLALPNVFDKLKIFDLIVFPETSGKAPNHP